MVTMPERMSIVETELKTIKYLVAATLGMKGIEWAWPPLMSLFSILA